MDNYTLIPPPFRPFPVPAPWLKASLCGWGKGRTCVSIRPYYSHKLYLQGRINSHRVCQLLFYSHELYSRAHLHLVPTKQISSSHTPSALYGGGERPVLRDGRWMFEGVLCSLYCTGYPIGSVTGTTRRHLLGHLLRMLRLSRGMTLVV